MSDHDVPAGALAVMNDGKMVLARGFGYSDRERTRPTQPDTPFRLASLTKAITNAAIRKLIREGKLKLDTPVFPLLALEPLPGQKPDPRLDRITVDHLMEHRGGWDSTKAGDPMFDSGRIAGVLGKPGPLSPTEVIRYMIGRPLQYDPGAKFAYSNFGYCVLGRVIEKVSGQSYERDVRDEIAAPLGITTLELGRTLPGQRNPREPYYLSPDTGPSLFDLKNKVLIPEPDGTFSMELMDSNGGLICSAPDYVRFLKAFQLNGEPSRTNGHDGGFFGSLPGTTAMALHESNRILITVVFNKRLLPANESLNKLREQMLAAVKDVKTWPTEEVSGTEK